MGITLGGYCGCGKPVRYTSAFTGEGSCNKYKRGLTREELEESLIYTNKLLLAYQNAVNEIDDYFEYRCESDKDKRKVYKVLQTLTENLENMRNKNAL